MDNNLKGLLFIIAIVSFVILPFILVEFLAIYDINFLFELAPKYLIDVIQKGMPKILVLKGIFFIMVLAAFYVLRPSSTNYNTTNIIMSLLGIGGGIMFVLSSHLYKEGLLNSMLFLLLDSTGFFLMLAGVPAIFKLFNTGGLKEEGNIFGLNTNFRDEWSLYLNTKKGKLCIPNPFRGITIVGGPGAGKSASLVKPLIWQTLVKGYTAFIYDFKGGDSESNEPPELSQLTYSIIEHIKRGKKIKTYVGKETPLGQSVQLQRIKYDHKIPKFYLLAPSRIDLSDKTNPMSPRYIKESTDALFLAQVLAYSIETKWIKDRDFWANNAVIILHATIWHLVKNYSNHKFQFSLPHVIELIRSDMKRFVPFITEDPEVLAIIRPLMEAIERQAEGQIAGALSTIQATLNAIANPRVYWILSGQDHEMAPLIPNDPNDPAVLCIASDSKKNDVYGPAMSVISSLVAQNINSKGKRPCFFGIDEFPTLYIHKFSTMPATARSNKVVTMIAMQNRAQGDTRFGQQMTDEIFGTLGNQFYGAVDDTKLAEMMSKTLGTYKKVKKTVSTAHDGKISYSEAEENTEVMKARDLMSQPQGQFVSRVADGDPPYGHPRFKLEKLPDYPLPVKKGLSTEDEIQAQLSANYQLILQDVNRILDSATDKAEQEGRNTYV